MIPINTIDTGRLRRFLSDADSAYQAAQVAKDARKYAREALRDAESDLTAATEYVRKGGKAVGHARTHAELNRIAEAAESADNHRIAAATLRRNDAATALSMAETAYSEAQARQSRTRQLADACRSFAAASGAVPSDISTARAFTASN